MDRQGQKAIASSAAMTTEKSRSEQSLITRMSFKVPICAQLCTRKQGDHLTGHQSQAGPKSRHPIPMGY